MSWNRSALLKLIESQGSWVVESEGDCLAVSNDEGVDVFVYVGGRQILVEAALFSTKSVKDKAALNELILRSHHYVPLTSVCIKNIANEDYYVAFGALSVDSKDTVVMEEIETLFENVTEFLDLCDDYLDVEKAL
ncbi:YjfI family protein [Marinomonas sp. C2222]|uniref:YjfI family protein n=1 Tax=Marinomonas sargassi TaxID=2984494 RepID=A0ABT2YTI5_9GAMM|nr:YjfI family protein [Marinomonas sargassi]MCV2403181.1 YjfI family protein [Marinomonas sargassi]